MPRRRAGSISTRISPSPPGSGSRPSRGAAVSGRRDKANGLAEVALSSRPGCTQRRLQRLPAIVGSPPIGPCACSKMPSPGATPTRRRAAITAGPRGALCRSHHSRSFKIEIEARAVFSSTATNGGKMTRRRSRFIVDILDAATLSSREADPRQGRPVCVAVRQAGCASATLPIAAAAAMMPRSAERDARDRSE